MADIFDSLHLDPKHLLPGGLPALGTSSKAGSASGSSFSSWLAKAADAVLKPQQAAEAAVAQFQHGVDGELHQTMLAQERADITLRFAVSVRNKALEAYREIMRMGA